jgi:hypothetical protein
MDGTWRNAAIAQTLHQRVHAAFTSDGINLFTQHTLQITPAQCASVIAHMRRMSSVGVLWQQTQFAIPVSRACLSTVRWEEHPTYLHSL